MPEPDKTASPAAAGRPEILGSITTPLIFFALALLIVEASLATVLVAGRLTESHVFFLVLVMAFLFLVVVLIVTLLTYFVPRHLMARLDEVVGKKVVDKFTDLYRFNRSKVRLKLSELRHELEEFDMKGPVDLLQPSLKRPGASVNPYAAIIKPTLEELLGDAMLFQFLPLREEFMKVLASPPGTIAEILNLVDKAAKALEQDNNRPQE